MGQRYPSQISCCFGEQLSAQKYGMIGMIFLRCFFFVVLFRIAVFLLFWQVRVLLFWEFPKIHAVDLLHPTGPTVAHHGPPWPTCTRKMPAQPQRPKCRCPTPVVAGCDGKLWEPTFGASKTILDDPDKQPSEKWKTQFLPNSSLLNCLYHFLLYDTKHSHESRAADGLKQCTPVQSRASASRKVR